MRLPRPVTKIISVIPAFQDLVREGGIGAVVLDKGDWMDLGDVESYLAAHQQLALQAPIHPEAMIDDGAVIENSVIGKGARIRSRARVSNSVVWAGADVEREISNQVVM